MRHSDFETFKMALLSANSVSANGKPLNDLQLSYYFEVLNEFSLVHVIAALRLHSKQCKFAPTPNDIVEIINSGNKRLSADEAWAMMPMNEFNKKKSSPFTIEETIVWTDEMAEAYKIASVFLEDGDKIAARMAFKSAYDRLCDEAVKQGIPPKWKVVPGYDKTLVAPVIEKAVLMGRLTQDEANRALMPPDLRNAVKRGELSQEEAMLRIGKPMDGGIIGKLLTGKVADPLIDEQQLKAHWKQLKESLDGGKEQLAAKKQQEIEDRNNRRLEFEYHRQRVIDEASIKLQGKLN